MFVKLFGSILDSSIWAADPTTKVVWITMLAMADEYGVVHASVGGLARRAQVPLASCRRALALLLSPDADDRSGEHKGCRIEELQGGWQVLNYMRYREMRTHKQMIDTMRQRKHRRNASHPVVTGHDVTTEAEVEAVSRGRHNSSGRGGGGVGEEGAPPALQGARRPAGQPTAIGDILAESQRHEQNILEENGARRG